MLEITDLTINIQQQETTSLPVKNLNLRVSPGEVLGLIGESGSGKSLTALAIMRLLPTSASYSATSQIKVHDHDLLNLTDRQMCKIRGSQIAMIFQDPMTSLNPVMTVGTQLAEVLRIHKNLQGRACYVESIRLLDAVRIPAAVHRYNSYPFELSGGMKQRVMLAIALAGGPALLIADEPTTALDVTTQAQILHLLREIQQVNNMALLLITHDLSVAAQMADRIAVLHKGVLVEENTAVNILQHPAAEYTQNLLNSVPSMLESCRGLARTELQKIFTVSNLQVHFPIKSGLLRRTVGHIKAVDGVDFSLYAGETLALVGESGCGKTSIGKAVLALLENVTGTVLYAGQDILQVCGQELQGMRADLQMIFQDPYSALDPKKRIIDSLEEGMLAQSKIDLRSERIAIIDDLLVRVGIDPEAKYRYPHQFSGGERQRICVARALTMQPQIIICDEATSSLDVSVQAQVLKLLQELQQERQIAYLFISHDLNVVKVLANRIAVMYLGRIVESGLTADVLDSPKHPYTQALLAAVPTLNVGHRFDLDLLAGEVPSPLQPPTGCHFHPRCKYAKAECKTIYPAQYNLSATHMVKCVLYEGA